MRRIKLVVSYDGTAYCGWQLQPNGVTIEEVLNKALSSLLKEDIGNRGEPDGFGCPCDGKCGSFRYREPNSGR